jgi:hypothetical protein
MHIHKFDSYYGHIPGHKNLALRCACGAWGMPAEGIWHSVPKELEPEATWNFPAERISGCALTGLFWAFAIEASLALAALVFYKLF